MQVSLIQTVRGPFMDMQENNSRKRLYYLRNSSASLRVVLLVRYAQLDVTLVEVEAVKGPLRIGVRSGAAFALPAHDEEARRLGTTDYRAFNAEGRVPVLLVGDKQLTQSGAILQYLMDSGGAARARPRLRALQPEGAWQRAVVRQVIDIVACDIHPLQNRPLTTMLLDSYGMAPSHGAPPARHPFRHHVIRRGFHALEQLLLARTGNDGAFAAGPRLSLADLYVVPQVRNALGAGVDVAAEFPAVHGVWQRCLAQADIRGALVECGGLQQHVDAYDAATGMAVGPRSPGSKL
eukprot:g1067.t1